MQRCKALDGIGKMRWVDVLVLREPTRLSVGMLIRRITVDLNSASARQACSVLAAAASAGLSLPDEKLAALARRLAQCFATETTSQLVRASARSPIARPCRCFSCCANFCGRLASEVAAHACANRKCDVV
jgi:hypothetical protein